nr:RluA family pseudouridine synthase [Granulosicoccus sp.]
MDQATPVELIIPEALAGQRLDSAMATLFPDYSRSRLQAWIRDNCVLLNGEVPSTRQKLLGGETLELQIPETTLSTEAEPENIPLDVIFEDEHLIVINKTADLVMHPAAGNWSGTVLNGLLYRFSEVSGIPRAGIVHRLDKDTTGLFVVARSLLAHTSLVDQLQSRSMGREYTAIVEGSLVSGGTVDEPIGRHPRDRKKMAVNTGGKTAVTHYRLGEKFAGHTSISVKLETGRRHQIRVHMAS